MAALYRNAAMRSMAAAPAITTPPDLNQLYRRDENCDGFHSCPASSGTCFTTPGMSGYAFIGCCLSTSCNIVETCFNYQTESSSLCNDSHDGRCISCSDQARPSCVVSINTLYDEYFITCDKVGGYTSLDWTNPILASPSSNSPSSTSPVSSPSSSVSDATTLTSRSSLSTTPTRTDRRASSTSNTVAAGTVTIIAFPESQTQPAAPAVQTSKRVSSGAIAALAVSLGVMLTLSIVYGVYKYRFKRSISRRGNSEGNVSIITRSGPGEGPHRLAALRTGHEIDERNDKRTLRSHHSGNTPTGFWIYSGKRDTEDVLGSAGPEPVELAGDEPQRIVSAKGDVPVKFDPSPTGKHRRLTSSGN